MTSFPKTVAFVGCSRSAVVSIYQKWSKEETVVNRRQWACENPNWTNGRRWPCLMNHQVGGWVCVRHLPGEHMAPGCTMGRRQAGWGSVMLWAMFCWETLGPAIHVDVSLTHTTYISFVADRAHPFTETVSPNDCGLYQQYNAPCHEAKLVQEWFEVHNNEFQVLTWPPNPPHLNSIEHLWDVLDKQVWSMKAPPHNLQD